MNYFERDLQRKIDARLARTSRVNTLVYNHFEVLKSIGSKSGLIRSLTQYYYTNSMAKLHNYTVFDTTPTTFLVKAKFNDDKTDEMMLRFR